MIACARMGYRKGVSRVHCLIYIIDECFLSSLFAFECLIFGVNHGLGAWRRGGVAGVLAHLPS
jgi:hypothetical protein